MNVAQRPAGALDIVQTRELTARDRRDLGHLWQKLAWRDGGGFLYTASFYLWYGFAAFLAVSILMAVRELNEFAPDLALQLVLAAAGFALFLTATHWLGDRLGWEKYWSGLAAGDQYSLAADGIRATTQRGQYWCGWNNVETVVNDDRRLVAVLSGNGGLFLVKSAFENQDIECFSAELVRRWREARTAPATGAPA
jgi:hypothetical protein